MRSKSEKRAAMNQLLQRYGKPIYGKTYVEHWQHVVAELERDLARPAHMAHYDTKQRRQWLRIASANIIAVVRDAMEV